MLLNQAMVLGRRHVLRPEERLLLAVVEAAYSDLRSREAVDRRRARKYFLADDGGHAFSFVAACQHFGWSAASIRMQLGERLAEPEAEGVAAQAAGV